MKGQKKRAEVFTVKKTIHHDLNDSYITLFSLIAKSIRSIDFIVYLNTFLSTEQTVSNSCETSYGWANDSLLL